MLKKTAFITGITGQDGSYLAELLLQKGYQVHGLRRRTSLFNSSRIDHIIEKNFSSGDVQLHYGDLSDSSSLIELVARLKPTEIYNLGAQSHVGVSFNIPEYTCDVDALGTLRLLQAVRHTSPQTKFYQASSSEMFGKVLETPQKETTPFNPQSPYAISKVFSYWTVKNYRNSYGIFACNGILFNHESPRRGRTFVTRKITRAVADIFHKKQKMLYLGNIHTSRDWGHAKDYVEAMYLMMQHKEPDDFIVATGETHTVKEFVELAFEHIGIKIKWTGKGLKETGYDTKTKKAYVKIDPQYFRPSEVEFLLGEPSKARKILGWKPRHNFKELVKEMVEFDIKNEGLNNGYLNY